MGWKLDTARTAVMQNIGAALAVRTIRPYKAQKGFKVKARAILLRPALSCIVRGAWAPRGRFKPFCARSSEINETLHIQANGLIFSQCSKTEQAETAISGRLRRAPAFKGGFLLLVWQGLNVSYGGLLTGSLRACRSLSYGYCRPDSDPRPSTAIESGIHSKNLGGHNYGKKSPYPSTRIQSHNSPDLHNAPSSTGAGYSYCFLRGAL